jgi:hypothetical protein
MNKINSKVVYPALDKNKISESVRSACGVSDKIISILR